VASLVDTNILVYRVDGRFPEKQKIATDHLRRGIADDNVRVPHQAVLEFFAAVTRPLKDGNTILSIPDAIIETEGLLSQFVILYPDEEVIRTALRGMAAYQMPWFDAHLWAFAECYGLSEIISEDFQDGHRYGKVTVVNPFRSLPA